MARSALKSWERWYHFMTRELFNERPDETWVEVLNEKQGAPARVHLVENITEVKETDEEGNEAASYEADAYTVETGYRVDLLDSVKASRDVWLSAAKEQESAETAKTLQQRVSELETMTGDLAAAILG